MTRMFRGGGLLAVLLVVALSTSLVACGGKDDNKNNDKGGADGGDSTSSSDSPASLPPLLGGSGSPLGRLFGSGDESLPQTSAEPTKDDERFAGQVCAAGIEFFKAMEKLAKELESKSSGDDTSAEDFGEVFGKLFEGMMGPLADFLDAFAKAQPPKDLAEWHKQAGKAMQEVAKALRKGDFEALADFDDSSIAEPPAEPSARLEKAFARVKECKELEKLSESDDLGGIFGPD